LNSSGYGFQLTDTDQSNTAVSCSTGNYFFYFLNSVSKINPSRFHVFKLAVVIIISLCKVTTTNMYLTAKSNSNRKQLKTMWE